MSKEAFLYVLNKINLTAGKRITAINPVIKLAMVLELMAKGSYQDLIGNDYLIGMAQSTVSTVLWEVIEAIENNLCSEWIKYEFSEAARMHFYRKFKLPGVVGCVDGTHVNLLRPKLDEHMFFNRKGKHSLNVMVVVDHNYKILSVCPKYGGAAHY